MRKAYTSWSNIYEAGECEIWRTIFTKYEIKLAATDFPTRRPWFGKFIKEEKLGMGIIRKQYFGISVLKMAEPQINWDLE